MKPSIKGVCDRCQAGSFALTATDNGAWLCPDCADYDDAIHKPASGQVIPGKSRRLKREEQRVLQQGLRDSVRLTSKPKRET